MPPVNQGSNKALVAWTAIMSIVAVAMLILTIYFYVDASKADDRMKNATDAVKKVVTTAVISAEADEIGKLEAAQSDAARGFQGMSLFNVALAQRNALAKLIGSDDEALAATSAKAAIDKAKAAGATADSLSNAVQALIAQLEAAKATATSAAADSAQSKQKLEETLKTTGEQIKKFSDDLAKINQEKIDALQQSQKMTADQASAFGTTASEIRKQLDAANESINQLNSQNASLGAQIEKMKIIIAQLTDRLGEKRADPTRAVIQQADGRVIRVPGSGYVFIDLGTADHVTQGLTFEVYDRGEGIPPLGDPTTNLNLPIGKASLEVISVLPTGSECRIIRQSPGTAIAEGDLIANLVFDKNTKYNFVVFGNFDLDQNGVATAADAEVMKRLITGWGGRVVPEINVDTDFVVLGKEPTVPEKPKENDPIALAAYDKAEKEAEEYASISLRAREYRMPILNQNRFLYMVGYYESAKR